MMQTAPGMQGVKAKFPRRHPRFQTQHKQGTAHFRCACGARLVFSGIAVNFTALAKFETSAQEKGGECPSCGRKHSDPLPGGKPRTRTSKGIGKHFISPR